MDDNSLYRDWVAIVDRRYWGGCVAFKDAAKVGSVSIWLDWLTQTDRWCFEAGKVQRSIVWPCWLLYIPWSHQSSTSTAFGTSDTSPLIYSVSSSERFMFAGHQDNIPSFKKGFASDQINAEQSQISQPWQQLCLLEGIKTDGISRG